MISTFGRRAIGLGTLGLVCALVCGCTRVVDGSGLVAGPGSDRPAKPAVLAELLIEPQRFPGGYVAAVLDSHSADGAIREIDGVSAGAVVEPSDCAPPVPGPIPRNAVAARGVEPDTSSTLTVALTRHATDLSVRREQVTDCAAFTTAAGEVSSSVTATPLPQPPVDADGSYAVELSVARPAEPPERVLALVAQIGDVRVAAAWTSDNDDAAPDTEALDALFRESVVKLRRGLGR